jgi:hypothetical protein
VNSLEKIAAFKDALIRTPEEFEGVLGALQGFVAIGELQGHDIIAESLGDKTADELDDELLDVIGFVLWARSDGARIPDLNEIAGRMPAEIAELAAAIGIV